MSATLCFGSVQRGDNTGQLILYRRTYSMQIPDYAVTLCAVKAAKFLFLASIRRLFLLYGAAASFSAPLGNLFPVLLRFIVGDRLVIACYGACT